uniref:Uncharacterized protein n=1 Tax=Neogobius melanostomus TaxID=47308 RepID=A0A8C6SMX7_9GOBI
MLTGVTSNNHCPPAQIIPRSPLESSSSGFMTDRISAASYCSMCFAALSPASQSISLPFAFPLSSSQLFLTNFHTFTGQRVAFVPLLSEQRERERRECAAVPAHLHQAPLPF